MRSSPCACALAVPYFSWVDLCARLAAPPAFQLVDRWAKHLAAELDTEEPAPPPRELLGAARQARARARVAARRAALERLGRIPEAVTLYQSVVAERPELGDVWYDLGRLLRRMRRLDDALAAYDQALAQRACDPQEIHLNRAVIFAEDLNRPDAAETELKTALALAPAYAPAWLNLGNLHEDAGRRDQAREAYEAVLAIDSCHVMALARLAGLQTATPPDDPLIGRLRSALAATPACSEKPATLPTVSPT